MDAQCIDIGEINVIDVNNNPVAVNDSISVNENATAEQTEQQAEF